MGAAFVKVLLEGEADMSLLSRFGKLPLAISILLAMFLVPVTETVHGPGSWPAATPVWAGGSPDETLNPPSTPPRARHVTVVADPSDAPATDATSTLHTTAGAKSGTLMTSTDRWNLLLRICLSSVLRF